MTDELAAAVAEMSRVNREFFFITMQLLACENPEFARLAATQILLDANLPLMTAELDELLSSDTASRATLRSLLQRASRPVATS